MLLVMGCQQGGGADLCPSNTQNVHVTILTIVKNTIIPCAAPLSAMIKTAMKRKSANQPTKNPPATKSARFNMEVPLPFFLFGRFHSGPTLVNHVLGIKAVAALRFHIQHLTFWALPIKHDQRQGIAPWDRPHFFLTPAPISPPRAS